MRLANFLSSNRSNFMFVDPSINATGLAIYDCQENGGQIESTLRISDLVRVDKEELATWDRALIMCERIQAFANQYQVQRIYIEEPPGTLYQGQMQQGNIGQLIGRANKIFKLTAVVYGLLGLLHHSYPKKVKTFLPIDWEPHFSHRKGMAIKDWSMWHANLVLEKQGCSLLKTKLDENVADAINQGYFLIQKFTSGKKDWN